MMEGGETSTEMISETNNNQGGETSTEMIPETNNNQA